MNHVDGFVFPVPTDTLDDDKKMARNAGKAWMEHSAQVYTECVGDDGQPGKRTSFPQRVKLDEGKSWGFPGSFVRRLASETGPTSSAWPIRASKT